MKKTFFTLIIAFSSLLSKAQIKPDWEMPMKEGIIYFRDTSKIFNNKKHDLCTYFTSQYKVSHNANTKLRSILGDKGGKTFSNTDYEMNFTVLSNKDSKNCALKDGRNITIRISKSKVVLWKFPSFKDQKIPVDKIQALINIEFIGDNQYVMIFKGFTVHSSKITMSKGYVPTDYTLEEIYNEFAKSEKKSKDQIGFFKDIKELISIFENTFSEELEHTIKVEELD